MCIILVNNNLQYKINIIKYNCSQQFQTLVRNVSNVMKEIALEIWNPLKNMNIKTVSLCAWHLSKVCPTPIFKIEFKSIFVFPWMLAVIWIGLYKCIPVCWRHGKGFTFYTMHRFQRTTKYFLNWKSNNQKTQKR